MTCHYFRDFQLYPSTYLVFAQCSVLTQYKREREAIDTTDKRTSVILSFTCAHQFTISIFPNFFHTLATSFTLTTKRSKRVREREARERKNASGQTNSI